VRSLKEEAMTMRLMVGWLSAELRRLVVALMAGWIKKVS
jgi:hypothetical protein